MMLYAAGESPNGSARYCYDYSDEELGHKNKRDAFESKQLNTSVLVRHKKAFIALYAGLFLLLEATEIVPKIQDKVVDLDEIIGGLFFVVGGAIFCSVLLNAKSVKSIFVRMLPAWAITFFISTLASFLISHPSEISFKMILGAMTGSLFYFIFFCAGFLGLFALWNLIDFFKKVIRTKKCAFSLKGLAFQCLRTAFIILVPFALSYVAAFPLAKFFWAHGEYDFWNSLGLDMPFKSLWRESRSLISFFFLYAAICAVKKSFWEKFSAASICAVILALLYSSASLYMQTGFEMDCIWNLTEDTKHIDSFNYHNIPFVKEGMTEEEAVSLLGEPYYRYEWDVTTSSEPSYTRLIYTSDGASDIGDFSWFEYSLKVQDGIVREITSRWMYD